MSMTRDPFWARIEKLMLKYPKCGPHGLGDFAHSIDVDLVPDDEIAYFAHEKHSGDFEQARLSLKGHFIA